MANEGKKSPKKLSPQSEAFLEMLTERGLVEDKQIDDEKRRKAEKEKKRKMFHLSMRLWASQGNQLDSWIDVLTILENL